MNRRSALKLIGFAPIVAVPVVKALAKPKIIASTEAVRIGTNGTIGIGTASPAYSFNDDPNTGMYWTNTDDLVIENGRGISILTPDSNTAMIMFGSGNDTKVKFNTNRLCA